MSSTTGLQPCKRFLPTSTGRSTGSNWFQLRIPQVQTTHLPDLKRRSMHSSLQRNIPGLHECAPGRGRSHRHRRCWHFRLLQVLLLSQRGQRVEARTRDSELVVTRTEQTERVQAKVVVEW